jgi:hypothetical protein
MQSPLASALQPSYDILIVGGGPAGVVAATQAARAGATVLLVEKSGMLGGTTTSGGVNLPGLFHAWGRQVIAGIGWEWICATLEASGGDLPDFSAWKTLPHWRLQVRVNAPIHAAVANRLVVRSGADLLLHTLVAGVENGSSGLWRVTLCGKEGLREVEARVLVDCSGDANLVGLAGFPRRSNARLQPGTLAMRAAGYDFAALGPSALEALERAFSAAVASGQMRRSDFQAARDPVTAFLRGHGGNSMHVPGVDGSTSWGRTQAELLAREALLRIVSFFRAQPGMESFTIEHCAPECGIRETVTIDGEVEISRADYESGRIWPDSLCYSFYPIDIHATDGKGGIDTRPLREGVVPTIPLGALLPKGSRNLVVAGRCACGDQEANSAFRVQASAMAMGQAAGAAAALAARERRELREVPIHQIRSLLRSHSAVVPEPAA